jgi:hypothetical protein
VPHNTLAAETPLLVAPEFIWEAFLGIYCTIWGFRRDSPILKFVSACHIEAGALVTPDHRDHAITRL